MFGSCRVAVPHEPPWTLTKDEDPEHGREIDALYALAVRMRDTPREEWPHVLLSIGDQVYADEDSPQTREFIRSRRDTGKPPGEGVLDFEEYTRLYWESWGHPMIRWLLSTVGVAMIFDDHDVHDDWNTSLAWLEEMREPSPGGRSESSSALMSYWLYQHLGNLSPRELEEQRAASEGARGGRRRPAAAPVRRPRGRGDQRQPLELPPRPRPHAADRVRLARGQGARRARGER